MQLVLTGSQAESLREVLQDHNDGDDVVLTKQPGESANQATVYVAFALASYTIDAEGEIEEAG